MWIFSDIVMAQTGRESPLGHEALFARTISTGIGIDATLSHVTFLSLREMSRIISNLRTFVYYVCKNNNTSQKDSGGSGGGGSRRAPLNLDELGFLYPILYQNVKK